MPDTKEVGTGGVTDQTVNRDTEDALNDPIVGRSPEIKACIEKRRKIYDQMRALLEKGDELTPEDKSAFEKMEVEERSQKDKQDRIATVLQMDDRLRQQSDDMQGAVARRGEGDIVLPDYRHGVAQLDERIDEQRLMKTWALGKHANREDVEYAQRCNFPLNPYLTLPAIRGFRETGGLIDAPRAIADVQSRKSIPHYVKRTGNYKTLSTAGAPSDASMDLHFRQQSVATGSEGGFTVPDEMMREIDIALLQFGVIRSTSTIIQTATGADMPIPTVDDTAIKGEIIAENAAANDADVTFGQIVLSSFKYSSKVVKCSIEWLQDSATNVPALLGRLLGERIGRIHADHFTVGTGTAQPLGIVTASALGATTAATFVDTFTFQDVMTLEHSVDPAYRPGAGFMMSDTALLKLKFIVDDQNRPLWQTSLVTGAPGTFDSYPITINQSVAIPAAAAKSMIFGDLSKYWIRDVLPMTFIRLDELGAISAQVWFLMWSRNDGDLIDAGTEPVKHLLQAAA